MNRFYILIIRMLLGAAFAVFLTRFFYPHANIVYVIGIGIILVGLSYFSEFVRSFSNRNKKD